MATFSLFFFCHLLHSLIEFEGSRSLEPGVSIGNGVSKWFCACCGCFTTRGTGTAFKERFVVYTLGLSQHQMEQVALDQGRSRLSSRTTAASKVQMCTR
ncbi:uncharacterized protein LOC144003821 isoform X5 [Festucalex cinctus]